MRDSFQDFSVAILAGGLGTRLRSVVADRPKVLAEIRGRPFLAYLLDELRRAEIRRVVLLVGYGAEQIRRRFGSEYQGMRLEYSLEAEPLGTAGAVRLALPLLEGKSLLLMNGDSFCDVDLHRFREFHRAHPTAASMVLTQVEDASRFGAVYLEVDDRVGCFQEKNDSSRPGWINAGIYLLDHRMIAEIAPQRCVSLERDMLPYWVAEHRVFGFRGGRRFIDIGVPDSYAAADRFFAPEGDGIDGAE